MITMKEACTKKNDSYEIRLSIDTGNVADGFEKNNGSIEYNLGYGKV
ncbi:hypothetical protein [Bacillus mycoides]|nr:hypothetical protein [Bacillus mycoides]